MLSASFLNDMRGNLENMRTLQQQMTSGKEIRRPSDDPFKVARAMQLHTNINANKQYNENISDTINWLDTTDTALGQAGNVLQRVRELMVSAGNAAYGSNERKAIKDEINEKIEELSQIMNTSFDGKYIFGGSRGTTKPMSTTKVGTTDNTKLDFNILDNGIPEDNQKAMVGTRLSVEVSQGVSLDYNVNAVEIMSFESEDGTPYNLTDLLKGIANHLDGKLNDDDEIANVSDSDKASAMDAITGSDLKGITDAINNLLKIRSTVGAKQNRMESAKDRNEEENFNMTEILTNTEDIDITEKTMQYATMQTVYMASLQTSAKVLQPTLMDYIR
jgi:flagellar hook-associated protein 3 FlgL